MHGKLYLLNKLHMFMCERSLALYDLARISFVLRQLDFKFLCHKLQKIITVFGNPNHCNGMCDGKL